MKTERFHLLAIFYASLTTCVDLISFFFQKIDNKHFLSKDAAQNFTRR